MITKPSNLRLPGIDLLRTFAIFCMVLNHCTEQLYHFQDASFALFSPQTQAFAFFGFTLGRTGAPCFLTITGYLLMDRTYSQEQAKRFWKAHWLHLLVCTWVWFSLYDIILAATGTPLSLSLYIQHLLFLQVPIFTHVWYMPAIIGLYLLIPVLSNGLRQLQARSLMWILALFSCYAFVLPAVNILLAVKGETAVGYQLSLGFSGGEYGLYLLMGSMVRKGVFRSVRSWMVSLLALLCFVGTILFQLWCYHEGYLYMVWYNFPLLYVLGICLLELASRLQSVPFLPIFTVLARYSFGVYLIHNIFLKWLTPWVESLPMMMPVKVFFSLVIACLISYLSVFCLARIPKIGPYLLYLKKPQPSAKRG